MTRARSLMTCASIVALCAVLPSLAAAQSTDTGAAGQALTTGTITSSTGNVVDGGANGAVNASGASTLITVDNATINNTTANDPGLNVFSTSSSGGTGVSAVFTGTNNIAGLLGAVTVSGVNESATIDTTAGGGTYTGGLNANSQVGSATILNGSNIITGLSGQAGVTATAGGTGAAVVESTGGQISGDYGISASSQGGDVDVGQNAGVTTAIALDVPSGIGISATTSGTGIITVKTGTGGTIDGGATGINAANAGGSGVINVIVGDAIGATTAPTGSAVNAVSGSGSVNITATASLASVGNGVYSSINGGAGTLTVATAGVTSTNGAGVDLNLFGAGATGAVNYTLSGPNAVSGTEGVYAANFGSGDITIQASDAGSSITGTNGAGVDARASGTGGVTINVAGSVSGTNNAVYTQATSGATNITVGGLVTAASGSAISATASSGGSITVAANSGVTVTGGSFAGIYTSTTSGATSITVGGPLSSGGTGIYATSTGGAISVAAAATISSTSGSGIYVNSVGQAGTTGGDAVSVGSADQRVSGVTGGGGNGVFAAGAGDVTIYAGTVTGHTRGVLAASQSYGDADGKVLIDVNGQVTAQNSYGVLGVNTGLTAADTLTINTAGVTSTGGSGISAQSYFGDVSVTASGPIQANAGNGSGWDGIYVGSVDTTAGDFNATVTAAGSVTGSHNGVTVDLTGTSTKGAITVNAAGPITGAYNGVYATSTGMGAINLGTLDAPLGTVTANNGAGVSANGAGDVNVHAGAVTATTNGIYTHATSGATSITVGGPLSSGGTGVYATSTGGAISVAAASTISSTTGSGIYVNSVGQAGTTGGGAVSVGSADQRVTGVTGGGGNGIFAAGAGDVTIYAGTVTGSTRGVLGASQSYGNSDGAVLIDVNGQVTARGSYGVLGLNNGLLASDTLTIRTAGVTSTGGSAISAQSYFGDVSITANGPIQANAGINGGWDGIWVGSADPSTGDFNATITAAGSVSGSFNGISADLTTTSAKGAITVDATGPITGAYSGVTAASTGAGAINLGTLDAPLGTVTAGNGTGVFASGAGDVNVYTGAVAASGGSSATRLFNPSTGANDGAATSVAAGQGFGIAAISTGGNVLVNASGMVTGGADGGVLAQALGSGSVSITTAGVTAGSSMGIEADSNGGDVTIAANGAVSGATYGIFVTNTNPDSAGRVTVTTGSTVTSGTAYGISVRSYGLGAVSVGTADQRLGAVASTGSTGILATGAGDVSVYASTVSGGTRGIVAANQGDNPNGAVVVDVTGPVIASEGFGVVAVNNGSLAANSITVNAGQVTSTDGSGISAQGGGDISINAAGPVVANAGANGSWDGIYADGEGDSLVTVKTTGAVTGSWNGIEAYSDGTTARSGLSITAGGPVTAGAGQAAILATAAGLGDVNVTVSSGATLTASGGIGVAASSTTGAVNITTEAGSAVAPGAAIGLQAISASGPITIVQGGDIGVAGDGGAVGLGIDAEIQSASATSDININSTGSIYVGSGTGLLSAAIYAANSGSGAVNVTTSGVIDPGAYGVVASSTGAGSTTVTTKGSILAQAAGLNLTAGTGGLNLTLGGNVTATGGPAVVATSAGAATINVSTGAVVTGLVSSPTQAVIMLDTASGQSSTINVGSGAVIGVADGSTNDIAIRATGGSVVVNNYGEIDGIVDFSALTGDNTGTLHQAPGTLFVASGTSNFGSTNADFDNSGTLQTKGQTTTFVFGGANNVFSNAGTVIVGGNPPVTGARVAGAASHAATPAPSSFVLTGLTTFDNTGTFQMINGVVGDSIVASGSTYVGSGAAKLAVDTVIGAPGSGSDFLVVGSSSGHTTVQVHDAAQGSFGAYNPTGTVIVQGATHAGDFTLDPASSWYNPNLFGGALDKPGFFFSQLGVDPASGATVLISAPKLQAYQFATLPTQAQTVWYDTTPQPERQGALRDQLAKGDVGDGRPGVWVKVEGATAQRDVNQAWSGAGSSYSYNAGYKQDLVTEMAGVDGLRRTADGMGVAYGMSAGYVQSTAHFDQASTRTEMSGWTLNGYATVTQKDVFAAFAFGGDSMTAKLTAPQLTGFGPQSVGVGSLGATFEAGVRKPFLFGSTIEPSVGLAYVHTTVGELKTAGADFHFDQAESLRASFGARMTGEVGGLGGGDWRTRYEVTLRGVDDLKGDNVTTLGSLGPSLPLTDNFQKAFGEATFGLTTQNKGGWSGSADVRERFNDSSTDTGLSLAVRYQF
jgi:hypothetical protein